MIVTLSSFSTHELAKFDYVVIFSHGCFQGISQDSTSNTIQKTTTYNINNTVDIFRQFCPNLSIFYAGVCYAGLYLYTNITDA